ncbi:MAG: acyltransferase [Oscillospiraceae bacterium]|nr:acyltransferase [Oscillospiraceae bacterium]
METDLNVLSGQRAGLFGLSILWIMLFHCSVRPAWFPLWLLASTGYAGVDVFLLLSGIGLYYSMERDPSPLRFYRRRLARLLPPFLLVALVYEGTRWAAGAIGAGDFLRNVTLISYWTRGDQSYWFLAAVGLFYLCYPLIYRMIKARHRLLQTLVLAASPFTDAGSGGIGGDGLCAPAQRRAFLSLLWIGIPYSGFSAGLLCRARRKSRTAIENVADAFVLRRRRAAVLVSLDFLRPVVFADVPVPPAERRPVSGRRHPALVRADELHCKAPSFDRGGGNIGALFDT